MAYSPKSAKLVQNSYVPKSAKLVTPEPSILEKISQTLLPSFTQLSQTAGAGLAQWSPEQRAAEQAVAQSDQLRQQIAQRAAQETDPAKKAFLLSSLQQTGVGQGQEVAGGFQQAAGLTDRQMQQTPAEFAGRQAVGTGAELASLLIPAGAGSTSRLARVGQAVTTGAKTGGLLGLSQASREADTLKDAAGNVLTGALTGAATGALVQGAFETPAMVQEAFQKGAKKITPGLKNLYKSTLKDNIADKKFYRQFGGEDKVVDEAIALKIPNTKNGVENYFNQYQDEFENTVTRELNKTANKSKSIDLDAVAKRARETVKKQFSADKTLQESANAWLDKNVEIYSGKTGLTGANSLRKGLDRTVGGQIAADINQGSTAMKKALATELRNEFRAAIPDLRPTFRKYQLLAGMVDAMKKEPIISLPEIISGVGLGTISSNPLAGIAGLLGAKAVRSPGLQRTVASQGVRLGQNISQEALKKPSVVVNPAVQALQRMINKENESKQTQTRLK